jgi:hypothetical protein
MFWKKKAEVCKFMNLLHSVGRLQGEWSPWPVGGDREMEPLGPVSTKTSHFSAILFFFSYKKKSSCERIHYFSWPWYYVTCWGWGQLNCKGKMAHFRNPIRFFCRREIEFWEKMALFRPNMFFITGEKLDWELKRDYPFKSACKQAVWSERLSPFSKGLGGGASSQEKACISFPWGGTFFLCFREWQEASMTCSGRIHPPYSGGFQLTLCWYLCELVPTHIPWHEWLVLLTRVQWSKLMPCSTMADFSN